MFHSFLGAECFSSTYDSYIYYRHYTYPLRSASNLCVHTTENGLDLIRSVWWVSAKSEKLNLFAQ